MSIENSLESVKGAVSGVASSPVGRVFLFGGLALVGLAVLRRSQGGAAGSNPLTGTGAMFATGGGGSGFSSSSPAPSQMTPSEQLGFQLEQGKIQAQIQGLINAQNLEQQKGLIGLSLEQAKAQTAANLDKIKAEFAFWNTPVEIVQSVARTGDTTATGILFQTPFQVQQNQQAQNFAQQLSQQTALYNAQAQAQATAAKIGQPNPWRLENIAKTVTSLAGVFRSVTPPSVNAGSVPSLTPTVSPTVPNLSPAPSGPIAAAFPSGVIPV